VTFSDRLVDSGNNHNNMFTWLRYMVMKYTSMLTKTRKRWAPCLWLEKAWHALPQAVQKFQCFVLHITTPDKETKQLLLLKKVW